MVRLTRTDLNKYRKKGYRITPKFRKNPSKILLKSKKGVLRLINHTIKKEQQLYHKKFTLGLPFDYFLLWKKRT